jgi:glutathione S-transferase
MPAPTLSLVIGNKSWSSWSLRPWLVMKYFNIPFEEVGVLLRRPDTRDQIIKHSPAGKVPVLKNGELVIWDSLAIIEHVADLYSEYAIWPRDLSARAVARAVSAEMHAGFQHLREHCPMDVLARRPMDQLPETVERNVRRIIESWTSCRTTYGSSGPFLFSDFSAADAMYAPVCSRFATYIPDLARYGDDGTAQAYVDLILALPQVQEWCEGARAETLAAAN